ncbi:uncharacterized protein LOC107009579 [Solanum pennellii]|uniref:Uncharacterized protein LOC107009579 n=1 Tax=Solanum pennellii TaxID=28526 RepID=A0ABM1V362_SOLPN|nr:uncharacterized protein LOC107009579 [Solanum pennellii]
MSSKSNRNRPLAAKAKGMATAMVIPPPPSTPLSESDYAFTITRTAVAQICSSIGFTAAEAPVLGILTDIAIRYLRTIAKSAADSANSACRTQANLVDTIAAVDELSSVSGFPGAWRATDCFLNSGAVKKLDTFTEDSKEIPFAKPLPRKIFSLGSRKGSRNVGSSKIEYLGGDKKHIPKWLPVMPVIVNHEKEIVEKRKRELWGYCGAKTEEPKREKIEEEKKTADSVEKERKGLELPLKRGKVRFKIGGGGASGVCRSGGIGKRVLCENWNFDDENSSKQEEQLDEVIQQQ